MASATCRPSCSSTSAITNLAPSRANMRAIAAMLDAVPEMMATLPPRTALNPWQLVELGVRECVLVGVEASHHLGPFHHMNTENTNGESTPPAITSLSPTRSGASSVRK